MQRNLLGRGEGEKPAGDTGQQQLTGAHRGRDHRDLRRRRGRPGVPGVQVDARRGLTGSRAQVQPADLVRRVRVQV
jgi:hypothetical protein